MAVCEVGMKAKRVVDADGKFVGIRINCPGCGDRHVLGIRPIPDGETESPHYVNWPKWLFNGNYESPYLSPSVHVRSGHYGNDPQVKGDCWCTYYEEHPEETKQFTCYVCHSFIRDGMIEFLNDCTHALAGQRVPLLDV
jgi:hypothetical protein